LRTQEEEQLFPYSKKGKIKQKTQKPHKKKKERKDGDRKRLLETISFLIGVLPWGVPHAVSGKRKLPGEGCAGNLASGVVDK